MQAIGPMQRVFIDALKSGKYRQIKGALKNRDYECCVLGVANDACKLGEKSGISLYNTYTEIGLYDHCGSSRDRASSLAEYNDFADLTFEEVANMIEIKPERWFKEVK